MKWFFMLPIKTCKTYLKYEKESRYNKCYCHNCWTWLPRCHSFPVQPGKFSPTHSPWRTQHLFPVYWQSKEVSYTEGGALFKEKIKKDRQEGGARKFKITYGWNSRNNPGESQTNQWKQTSRGYIRLLKKHQHAARWCYCYYSSSHWQVKR